MMGLKHVFVRRESVIGFPLIGQKIWMRLPILTHELGVPVKTFNKKSFGWYPGAGKKVKLKETAPLAGPNYVIKMSVRGTWDLGHWHQQMRNPCWLKSLSLETCSQHDLSSKRKNSLQASSPIWSSSCLPFGRVLFMTSPKWRACLQAKQGVV